MDPNLRSKPGFVGATFVRGFPNCSGGRKGLKFLIWVSAKLLELNETGFPGLAYLSHITVLAALGFPCYTFQLYIKGCRVLVKERSMLACGNTALLSLNRK